MQSFLNLINESDHFICKNDLVRKKFNYFTFKNIIITQLGITSYCIFVVLNCGTISYYNNNLKAKIAFNMVKELVFSKK